MSKDSSAKYYQNNIERLPCERYQSLSKEEKEKQKKLLWTIQKSTRRWKTKACWVKKKIL